MGFYDFIFLICQLERLFNNMVRNGELPDVMKQSAQGSRFDIFLGHAQLSGKNIADEGNVHAMGKGKVIILPHVVKNMEKPGNGRGIFY